MLPLLLLATLCWRTSVQKSWKNFFNNTIYYPNLFLPSRCYDVFFNFPRAWCRRVRGGLPFLPQPYLPATERHLFFIGLLSNRVFTIRKLGAGIRCSLFVVPITLGGNSYPNSADAS